VQDWMGHTDIESTMRYYLKFIARARRSGSGHNSVLCGKHRHRHNKGKRLIHHLSLEPTNAPVPNLDPGRA
jgi:hypothetical protein